MERKEISVYTKLEKIEENYNIMAIKNNNVIKYIDLANNKMVIDMENDIITRENSEYEFTLDFKKNKIFIYAKKLKMDFIKEIKTLILTRKKNSYLVRYSLMEENMVNEYFVKFKN